MSRVYYFRSLVCCWGGMWILVPLLLVFKTNIFCTSGNGVIGPHIVNDISMPNLMCGPVTPVISEGSHPVHSGAWFVSVTIAVTLFYTCYSKFETINGKPDIFPDRYTESIDNRSVFTTFLVILLGVCDWISELLLHRPEFKMRQKYLKIYIIYIIVALGLFVIRCFLWYVLNFQN